MKINKKMLNMKEETIFTIQRKPILNISEDESGIELNDGYNYTLNAALPEIADAIAKFAAELPNQGMGNNSDSYFIHLLNEYFHMLSSTDVK